MGRVIRAAGRRVDAIESTAAERASAILDDAKAEAERTLADASREAARVRGDAEADAARRALAQGESARRELDELVRSRRAELVDLAIAVGAHLARATFATDPAAVRALVDDALGRLGPDPVVTVRLCAADAGSFEDDRVVVDESLDVGDVVVESQVGRVDARFRTRLAAVADALRPR